MRRWNRLVANTVLLVSAAWAVLPVLVILQQSLGSDGEANEGGLALYRLFFGDRLWLEATARSIVLALIASGLAVCVALVVVWEVKGSGRGRRSLPFTLASIPLPALVPAVVLGLGLARTIRLLGCSGSAVPLLVTHVALAMPFSLICCLVGARNIQPEALHAASASGAKPMTAVCRVLAPQMSRALIAGWLVGFLFSANEVVATQFLAGPRFVPLAVKLWAGLRYDYDPKVYVVGSLSVLLLWLVLPFLLLTQVGCQNPRLAADDGDGAQRASRNVGGA